MANPMHLGVRADGTSGNPVTTPAPDAQQNALSWQERAARAHTQRDPSAPESAALAPPRFLAITDNAPPALKVPAQESRPRRHPFSWAWGAARREAGQWEQSSPGTHGEIAQGVQSPDGTQTPFQRYGNTYRLPPEPWDAQLFIGTAANG